MSFRTFNAAKRLVQRLLPSFSSMKFFKDLLILFSISTILLHPQGSFAAREHSEEVCVTKLGKTRLSFYAQFNEPLAVIQGPEGDIELTAQYVMPSEEPLASSDEDLILKVLKQKRKKKRKFQDDCYSGKTGSFVREVSVEKASATARQMLGIKKTQTLKMFCQWQDLESRDDCAISSY